MNKHYELLYIVSLKYTGDELQKVMEDVTSLIKKNNGTITSDEVLGKQKMAYPINTVYQGTYVAVEFDMPGENLKNFDREMKLNREVLRFLVISKKIKTPEEIEREKAIQERLLKRKEEELAALEGGTVKVVKDDPVVEVKADEPVEAEEVAAPAVTEEVVTTVATPEVVIEEASSAKVASTEIKQKEKKSKVSLDDLDKKLDEILTDDIL